VGGQAAAGVFLMQCEDMYVACQGGNGCGGEVGGRQVKRERERMESL